MEYEKKYQDFYSKYYDKAELLIKVFLIKRKTQKKTFNISINEILEYLSNYIINKQILHKNENLQKLHQLFCKRYIIYEIDQVQEIFANDIKIVFDKIKISDLPVNYDYTKFIKEIAIIEVATEISRLALNNSRMLEMFYILNEFDEFEIRHYEGLSLNYYPIFKKIHSKLYPEYYTHLTKNEDSETSVSKAKSLNKVTVRDGENIFTSLFLNSDVYSCFLEYQKHIIDFYSDYSYLKKRLEKERLIHYHKDNDFMKMIYEDMELISDKNYSEYCINGKLKSLEKSYSVQRENNFNIIFDTLL